MNKIVTFIVGLVVLLSVLVTDAPALTDEEVYRTLIFNFITPGARALAFGGAFIALADDATAAEANPAGLTILVKPELFGEFRRARFNEDAYGTEAGLFGSSDTYLQFFDYYSPTFFSFTYPTPYFTLAFSRQEVMNIKSEVYSTFDLSVFWDMPSEYFLEETWGTLDLKLVNWNISVAKKITETISAGFSVRICTIKANSRVNNYVYLTDSEGPDFTTLIRHQTDVGIGANFGILWRPKEYFSMGFVYRNQPKLQLEEDFIVPAINIWGREPEHTIFKNTFNLPDSYGLGISLRPTPNLTFSFDLVRMMYTDLLEDFKINYNPITIGLTEGEIEVPFTVQDGNEYHVGGEYVFFIKKIPVALRAGYYSDPPHQIGLDEDLFWELNEEETDPVAEVFPAGELEHHITGGLGIAMRDNMQIDIAYDYNRYRKETVASFIYRF
ncbi:MAG: hypothetical protein A2Y62_20235 [Candidatus Fischerbacteria bacterium RBG_13_37_8]|uniref:PorV/PorQ family protein n=1 Tax=Candidatus Fischerbacteria bacterium RBG_13_37_8 TaxID=1817863 RepID=A0A1F5VFG9_9BACT|nr:MAG: hypothetical protein A2Y62_20235 [Candidatus Fischerbacteria bacterium RBG_13_37_8]